MQGIAAGSVAPRVCAALPESDRVIVAEYVSMPEFVASVRGHAPKGVRAVIDSTGSGSVFSAAIDALGWRGVAVTCASQPEQQASFDLAALYRGRRIVRGIGASDFADVRHALADLAAARVRVPIAASFELASARAAARRWPTAACRERCSSTITR
ncbi:MAG: zinc-binding dehydrogenase [Streptosporangiaceae bacterium]